MKKTDVTAHPPVAVKQPLTHEIHGIKRHDDYGWLRADNWQEVLRDPSTLDATIAAHLEAENLYQSAFMAGSEELQQKLIEEMKGRIKQDDSTVPYKDGDFAYGNCYQDGDEHLSFFRTAREGGERFIYLNGNKEAQGGSYFRFGKVVYAPDHRKFVWGYDDRGSEFYILKIRDFTTLQDNEEIIIDTDGTAVWDAYSRGFFYTRLDASHRSDRVYYHLSGTNPAEDVLIYKEEDPGFFVSVRASADHSVIMIEVHDHETSEVHVIDATRPLLSPKRVQKRQKGIEYSLAPAGDVVYILTNQDRARDFKIMSMPAEALYADSDGSLWQELVYHEAGRLIVTHQAFQSHLVWLERAGALARIVLFDRRTGETHTIAFDEEAYALSLLGSAEYDSNTIRFSYSSMTTPRQIFDYDMYRRTRTLLQSQEIPSGHEPHDYITRRFMVAAADGEQIPVSLLYHKTTALDGSSPCLLYGYGAYGIVIEAGFNSNILSLVDRGFIYAIAHIRGGKDKGFAWYEQGRHRHKRNTFTDFIAVGRHLVSTGLTRHDRLVAEGGSAGGMLMGAIANMAGQDYAAIVANVPFVDVLATMLDASLPLTPPEWPEWGNPLEDTADYALIASYSPYDNVKPQAYPPILAIAGLCDPRVTYWEAAKWVARLREMKTDNNPVLLRINMEAGHGGVGGRLSRLEETAYIHAFILKITGRQNGIINE